MSSLRTYGWNPGSKRDHVTIISSLGPGLGQLFFYRFICHLEKNGFHHHEANLTRATVVLDTSHNTIKTVACVGYLYHWHYIIITRLFYSCLLLVCTAETCIFLKYAYDRNTTYYLSHQLTFNMTFIAIHYSVYFSLLNVLTYMFIIIEYTEWCLWSK